MINARKVENELNVFAGLFASHIYWVVWVVIVAFQVRRGQAAGARPPSPWPWVGPAGPPACLPGQLPTRAVRARCRASTSHPASRCHALPLSLQIIIMFFLGGIFKVEHLSGLEWLISILIGLGSLPYCLLTKLVTRWAAELGCSLRALPARSALPAAACAPAR